MIWAWKLVLVLDFFKDFQTSLLLVLGLVQGLLLRMNEARIYLVLRLVGEVRVLRRGGVDTTRTWNEWKQIPIQPPSIQIVVFVGVCSQWPMWPRTHKHTIEKKIIFNLVGWDPNSIKKWIVVKVLGILSISKKIKNVSQDFCALPTYLTTYLMFFYLPPSFLYLPITCFGPPIFPPSLSLSHTTFCFCPLFWV